MAHEIDLKRYDIYTDLVVESYDKENLDENIIHKEEKYGDILVFDTEVLRDDFKKKRGMYSTITFKDISDKDNFKKVEEVLIKVLTRFLDKKKITMDKSCLVVGLGNELSTPDALGPNVSDKILVTKYLFELGDVESGYRDVSAFKPSVTGVTGIETCDFIKGVVDIVKPDFIIVIDALSSSAISRLNKTIQITDTGISPGSGIGNYRKSLDEETFNIPVISIGVPTVASATTIVSDTFKYMLKQFSFNLNNQDNKKLKFVPESNRNYLDHDKELSKEEKEKVLGYVGLLEEDEFRTLVDEVLTPIEYNLVVTVKEIDFVIEKLALLLSNGINKTLHKAYNTTNN